MPGEAYTEEGLGPRFWLTLIGVVLGIGLGALLLFALVGATWARWGGLGALVFLGALLIGAGLIYDRRQAKE